MANHYDDKVKQRALELSDEVGVKEAAKRLNLDAKTISYFRGVRKKEEAHKVAEKHRFIAQVENPEKAVKDNPFVTFTPSGEQDRPIKRGEMYYIHKRYVTGNEMASGRPAIIVSNDEINSKRESLEVIFLTTKPQNISPVHVVILSTGQTSTAICEKVSTIDASFLGEYIAMCTPGEMRQIDEAIIRSLNLEKYTSKALSDTQIISRINSIKAERDAYKRIYDELFERFIKLKKEG